MTDEEIARAQAVEVDAQNRAVQALTIGQGFTSDVDGRTHGRGIWQQVDGEYQWDRLESIRVLEVRQSVQSIDLRIVERTGVIATWIDNTPDYYSWEYTLIPKNFDDASKESQDRVFADVLLRVESQGPATDWAWWKREEGGEQGYELNAIAASNLQLLETTYDAYIAAMTDARTDRDLRDIVAAEDAYLSGVANFQPLEPDYV